MIQYFATNFTRSDDWSEDLALFRDAINEWNHLEPVPRFIAICGDLANEWPGSVIGNKSKRREQLDDFRNALESNLRSDIPLVLLGGNHDFLNTPTRQTIQQYTKEFGDDYYSFWTGGVMFIVLNVQLYKDNSGDGGTELWHEQDQWLDKQLLNAKVNNYTHIIVLQHVPWFLHNIDEPEDEMVSI